MKPVTTEGPGASLRRHGVEIVHEATEVRDFGGGRGRSVYFRDPDGSLLELVALGGG